MEERSENSRVIVRMVLILGAVFFFSLALHPSVIAAKPGVAAGWNHNVGLKSDGTVVAVGRNEYGECNVESWSGIVQVAAGGGHTVGLKSDDTAVTAGTNEYDAGNVADWDLGVGMNVSLEKSSIGVFRPSTGQWYLDLDGDGKFTQGVDGRYGLSGADDQPVVGKFLPRPF